MAIDAPAHGARVLVVDDDRDTVLTLGILLRSEGFQVQMLRTGGNVPEAVSEFRPHVVLLDIRMPDRNGFQVAQELRNRYGRKYPVLIALTARKTPVDHRLAEISGFDHYVPKPYDPAALLALVCGVTRNAA